MASGPVSSPMRRMTCWGEPSPSSVGTHPKGYSSLSRFSTAHQSPRSGVRPAVCAR